MDFGQGQTQAQARICGGEGRSDPLFPLPPRPLGPAGLGDPQPPPPPNGYSDLRRLSGKPSPVSGAEVSPAAGSLTVRLEAGLVGGPGQRVLRLGQEWLGAWNPGPLLSGVTGAIADDLDFGT